MEASKMVGQLLLAFICCWLCTSVCGQCNYTTADACAAAHNAIFNATAKNATCANYTATVTCVKSLPAPCLLTPSMTLTAFFANAQIEDNCCGDPLQSTLTTAGLTPHNCTVPTVSKCNISAAVACVQTFESYFQTASYLNYSAYCPDYNATMNCFQTNIPTTDISCQQQASTQPAFMSFFSGSARLIDNCCSQQASAVLTQLGTSAYSCAGGTGAAPTTTTTPAPGATTTTPPIGSCDPVFAASFCLPPFQALYSAATTYTSLCGNYTDLMVCLGNWIDFTSPTCQGSALGSSALVSFLSNEARNLDDCCGNPLQQVLGPLGWPAYPCPPGGVIPTTTTTTPAPTTPTTPTTTTVSPPSTQPTTGTWTIPVLLTTTATTTATSDTWSKDGPVAQISKTVLIAVAPCIIIGGFAFLVKKVCLS